MNLEIYQIDHSRDRHDVCFVQYDSLPKFQGSQEIDSSIYNKVYDSSVDCENLEDVYRLFNIHIPDDFRGRALSVSDVIKVEGASEVKDGFYFCNSFGFQEISFDSTGCQVTLGLEHKPTNAEQIKEDYPAGTLIELIRMDGESRMPAGLKGEVVGVDDIGQIHMKWENGRSLAINPEVDEFNKLSSPHTIRVLHIQPGQKPQVRNMEDNLDAMQEMVGGMIEEYMPFADDVAIICNEEGKLNHMELNRAIYDENHQLLDVIAGDFFIAYAPPDSETFLSLPEDKLKKYYAMFRYPDLFLQTEKGLTVSSCRPAPSPLER